MAQERRAGQGDRYVVALDPRTNRTGFAVVKNGGLVEVGSLRPQILGKSVRAQMIGAGVALLDRYRPSVFILPKVGVGASRRSDDTKAMVSALRAEGIKRGLVVPVSYPEVRAWYQRATGSSERATKRKIHELLIEVFPTLTVHLPRPRKVYDPDAYSTPMFDAIALYATWADLKPVPTS